ncbi:hypothetical protein L0F63_004789 [Massospora cicadina]|nr:hypothetical protein L0F63_004789 [Massospora cicadina]
MENTASMVVLGNLVVISVIGLVMNVFLIYMLKWIPEKSASFQLIWVVGVVDLAFSVTTMLVCVFRLILGFSGAYSSWFYCPILGSTTFFLCGVSGILMGVLALERYSVVCHQHSLPRGVIWALPLVLIIAAAVLFIGNSVSGGFVPEPAQLFCMPESETWTKYAILAVDLPFNLPLVVLFFCYVSIFVKCYRLTVPNQDDSITRKAAIKALALLAIYFLCYSPKFSTTTIGLFYNPNAPPKILYMLIPIGMTLIAVVNPMLVILLHRRIKLVAISYFNSKNYTLQME